jgi:hypothetical protein
MEETKWSEMEYSQGVLHNLNAYMEGTRAAQEGAPRGNPYGERQNQLDYRRLAWFRGYDDVRESWIGNESTCPLCHAEG